MQWHNATTDVHHEERFSDLESVVLFSSVDEIIHTAKSISSVLNATGTGADEIPAPDLQKGAEETDLQCCGGLLTTTARRGAHNNRC